MHDFNIGDLVEVVSDGRIPLPDGSIHLVHGITKVLHYEVLSLCEYGKRAGKGYNSKYFVKYEGKENTLKIDMQKKYRMVGTHEPVRVICTDRADPKIPCVGLYLKGEFEGVVCFSKGGRNQYNTPVVEEVPAVDWSKVPVDTPIWVKYAGDVLKRHFNKFDGKYVYFYPDGTTSFTCPENDPGFTESPDNCWLEEPK